MSRKRTILIFITAIFVIAFLFIMSDKSKESNIDESRHSSLSSKELYERAVYLRKRHDVIEAKEVYTEILTKYPDADNIETVQKEFEKLNLEIIFSNIIVPDKSVIHDVVSGDTLDKLAKRYKTTIELIKKKNNLRNNTIRIGQKLCVWTETFSILIDKSQNMLILKDNNEVIKVYEVSTGENNSTPVGTFKIITKLLAPVWFNRGVIVAPESPQNVLGNRWLGFDIPGYGISGTIDSASIGKQITSGCIRMRNEDVEEIYSMLPVGTEVSIVD